LEQSQFQVKKGRTALKEFQSHLHDSRNELKRADHQIYQLQGELEQSQSQLHQTQGELEQSQSQLHQTQGELEQSQSQLHQTQGELEQSQSQLHQTQVDLVRTQLQQQYVTTEPQSQNGVQYKLLVWDAWYAYENGDLKKMQQCLQESLKLTQISRTECLINWLESFVQFSAEKGQSFDTYTLTNLQEWKHLVGRTVAPKVGGKMGK
jgi:chromosome segregation ATPase